LLRREAVQRIGVELVLLEMALRIVEAYRPEAVDRDMLDHQPMGGFTVVLAGSDVEIECVLLRIAAEGESRSDQMANRVDLFPGPERAPRVWEGFRERQKRIAHLLLA